MDDQNASDYHNFSPTQSSTHRLPTLNGVQALVEVVGKRKPIPTRLANLDATLSTTYASPSDGGICRGCVTEIYGPPGCGKTHFAIQVAASALVEDEESEVTWIDTSTRLPFDRLEQFLERSDKAQDVESSSSKDRSSAQGPRGQRFNHLYLNSLPHLLALLLHPPEDFPSENTSLLVIDDFSTLVMSGLPQNDKPVGLTTITASLSRDDILAKSIAARRSALLTAISSGLARIAASRNLAVIVLSKASSNLRNGEKSAVLKSTLNSQHWNDNISTKIVIYRDFWPAVDRSRLSREQMRKQKTRERWPLRIVEIERLGGQEIYADKTRFVILQVRTSIQVSLPQLTVHRTDFMQ